MGGDLGPADSVDYGTAPFLIMHDDLKMALDGDQLSSDASSLIIQNTNPAGGIVFRTGASIEDRLVIDSGGNVTIPGLLDASGNISISSIQLQDGTAINASSIATQTYVDDAIAESSVIINPGSIVSWGYNSNASGYAATAWGYNSNASGYAATAWGSYNVASSDGATAWGRDNVASGVGSTVWGIGNKAESQYSTVFGRYNIGGFTLIEGSGHFAYQPWVGNDPLLEIGAGELSAGPANALTLLKDGRIALGKHTSMGALQAQPETVRVEGALKIGDYATDPGTNASEGAIRFGDDGSGSNDLQVYIGGEWKSLTQSAAVGTVQGDISMGAFTAQ